MAFVRMALSFGVYRAMTSVKRNLFSFCATAVPENWLDAFVLLSKIHSDVRMIVLMFSHPPLRRML
jgi:hypothetical protein